MEMCPACGYGADFGVRYYADGWMIDPRGAVAFKSEAHPISPVKARILHALAQAKGEVVTPEALANLMPFSDRNDNIAAHVSQLRHKVLPKLGLPVPFLGKREGVVGGYRWCAPVSVNAHIPEVTHA